MEPWPEVEAADEEGFHYPLGFGEPGDHGMRAIGEGDNRGRGGVGMKDASNEGLSGGIGEAMSVKDGEGSDGGGWNARGEEVGDEDARCDEEGGAGGVEGSAVVGGEIRG